MLGNQMPAPRLQWIVPTPENPCLPHFQRRGGTIPACLGSLARSRALRAGVEEHMNGIIYLVGLIVVILAILSFLGLR